MAATQAVPTSRGAASRWHVAQPGAERARARCLAALPASAAGQQTTSPLFLGPAAPSVEPRRITLTPRPSRPSVPPLFPQSDDSRQADAFMSFVGSRDSVQGDDAAGSGTQQPSPNGHSVSQRAAFSSGVDRVLSSIKQHAATDHTRHPALAELLTSSQPDLPRLRAALSGQPLATHAIILAACAGTRSSLPPAVTKAWGEILLPVLLQSPATQHRRASSDASTAQGQQQEAGRQVTAGQHSGSQGGAATAQGQEGEQQGTGPQLRPIQHITVRHIRHTAALLSILHSLATLKAPIGLEPMGVIMLWLQPHLHLLSCHQLVGLVQSLADLSYFPYTAAAQRLAAHAAPHVLPPAALPPPHARGAGPQPPVVCAWMTSFLAAVCQRLDEFTAAQICAVIKSLSRLDMHPWAANGPHQAAQRALAAAVASREQWKVEVADLLPRARRAEKREDCVFTGVGGGDTSHESHAPSLTGPSSSTGSSSSNAGGSSKAEGDDGSLQTGTRYRLFRLLEVQTALWVLLYLSLPVQRGWQQLLLVSAAQHAELLTPRALVAVFRVMAEYRYALPQGCVGLRRLWEAVAHNLRHFSPASIASLLWYAHHAGVTPPRPILRAAVREAAARARIQRMHAAAVAATAPTTTAPPPPPLPAAATVKALAVVQLVVAHSRGTLRLCVSDALPLVAVLGGGLQRLHPALAVLGVWSLATALPNLLHQHTQDAATPTHTQHAHGVHTHGTPMHGADTHGAGVHGGHAAEYCAACDAAKQLRGGLSGALGLWLRHASPSQCVYLIWGLQLLGLDVPGRSVVWPLVRHACTPPRTSASHAAPTPATTQQDTHTDPTSNPHADAASEAQDRAEDSLHGVVGALTHLSAAEAAMAVCAIARADITTRAARRPGRQQAEPGPALSDLLPALVRRAQSAPARELRSVHPWLLTEFIASVSKLHLGTYLNVTWWAVVCAEVHAQAAEGKLDAQQCEHLLSAAARRVGRAGRAGADEPRVFKRGLDVGILAQAALAQCEVHTSSLGSSHSAMEPVRPVHTGFGPSHPQAGPGPSHTQTTAATGGMGSSKQAMGKPSVTGRHQQGSLSVKGIVNLLTVCAESHLPLPSHTLTALSASLTSRAAELTPGGLARAGAAVGAFRGMCANGGTMDTPCVLRAVVDVPARALVAARAAPAAQWSPAGRRARAHNAHRSAQHSVSDMVLCMSPDQLALVMCGVAEGGVGLSKEWLCAMLGLIQARAPGHMTHIGVRNVTKALLRMGHWPGADFLACMREQLARQPPLAHQEALHIASQLSTLDALATHTATHATANNALALSLPSSALANTLLAPMPALLAGRNGATPRDLRQWYLQRLYKAFQSALQTVLGLPSHDEEKHAELRKSDGVTSSRDGVWDVSCAEEGMAQRPAVAMLPAVSSSHMHLR